MASLTDLTSIVAQVAASVASLPAPGTTVLSATDQANLDSVVASLTTTEASVAAFVAAVATPVVG